MTKAKLRIEKTKDLYLSETHVENIFINELLPVAPGEYVKVYLFCLMYAERGEAVAVEMAAKALGMTPDEVEKAWDYWEDWGAVRRFGTPGFDDFEIVFLNQAEEFYNRKNGAPKAGAANGTTRGRSSEGATDSVNGGYGSDDEDVLTELTDREMRALFEEYERTTGRTVSKTEMNKISDTITMYGVTPDVFSYAIKYSAELGNFSIDYIKTVAIRWKEAGCLTIADAKAYVDRYSRRFSEYKSIFTEMGFFRSPGPGDKEIMDKWLDEWGLSLAEILEACRKTAGMREPSLKYVNKVLENRLLEAGGIDPRSAEGSALTERHARVSRKVLEEYYKYLRDDADRKYKERVREVSEKLPVMQKIITEESEISRELLTIRVAPGAKERIRESRLKLKQIAEERKRVLVENGLPENYLERRYRCEMCKDTGITDDGRYCDCAKERAEEAYTWNKTRNQ